MGRQRIIVAENGDGYHGDGGRDERDIRDLQELFSKLNPMAEEFVPPSLANGSESNGLTRRIYGYGRGKGNGFVGYNGGENGLLNGAALRRVTEEQLAALFVNCGQDVDHRICGDPNSLLRFAFIDFIDECIIHQS